MGNPASTPLAQGRLGNPQDSTTARFPEAETDVASTQTSTRQRRYASIGAARQALANPED